MNEDLQILISSNPESAFISHHKVRCQLSFESECIKLRIYFCKILKLIKSIFYSVQGQKKHISKFFGEKYTYYSYMYM